MKEGGKKARARVRKRERSKNDLKILAEPSLAVDVCHILALIPFALLPAPVPTPLLALLPLLQYSSFAIPHQYLSSSFLPMVVETGGLDALPSFQPMCHHCQKLQSSFSVPDLDHHRQGLQRIDSCLSVPQSELDNNCQG